MPLTFIDTKSLPKQKTAQGEATEVLNEKLVGAKNVVATLRWLSAGERFDAKPADKHQLIYLVEGDGSIELDGKDYDVRKGAGVYLGPDEGATVSAGSGGSLKLFHLVVPPIPA
jgi:quercetin dioxygenase-like cupin family protein